LLHRGWPNRRFFRRKFVQIAEISDHNIEPRFRTLLTVELK
jgi:hypothetical protein